MGLDITAYEIIQPTKTPRLPDGELDYDEMYERGIVEAYLVNSEFSQSFRGLELGQCYQTSGQTYSFRAGSYSGYNHFRAAVSVAVLGVDPHTVWDHREAYRNKPFFELINFSDCEGTIGPEACADLKRDFDEHSEDVLSKLDDWYQNTYKEFQLAFDIAADTGLVNFH
jgi:hypothetical protein